MGAQPRLERRDLLLELVARGRRSRARIYARGDGARVQLRPVLSDVGAPTVPGDDKALALEALVNGACRVDVHPHDVGQPTNARKLLAGQEAAARDERLELPRELGADRDIPVAVDLEAERLDV